MFITIVIIPAATYLLGIVALFIIGNTRFFVVSVYAGVKSFGQSSAADHTRYNK